ncbi:hypothetical protein H8356DRAFT_1432124 [Neocallimastix lanati (nom. inval.)]|nr:hypothetical protein H8356DRAFT_1432124 [Neocallimastix sp. JGI-2020a]
MIQKKSSRKMIQKNQSFINRTFWNDFIHKRGDPIIVIEIRNNDLLTPVIFNFFSNIFCHVKVTLERNSIINSLIFTPFLDTFIFFLFLISKFNWILLLRCGYKYNTTNIFFLGNAKDVENCHKCDQSFIHWRVECSLLYVSTLSNI